MKLSQLILLAIISVGVTMIACKDSAEESKSDTPETVSPNGNATTDPGIMDPTTPGTLTSPSGTLTSPTGAATTGGTPATAAGSQAHYTCQTPGCTGSGAAQGNCPVCSKPLVHNAAYHAQANPGAPSTTPTTPIMIDPATGKPTTATPATPPSAKNAAGEYHYACPAGHAGGAAAGKCSTCGAELTHNSAYHNK